MSTLSELIKKHGQTNAPDLEWFHILVADWQIVADMLFADLVLWVPNQSGDFIAVSHARPSSAATIFYRDISGEPPTKPWEGLIREAFNSGNISNLKGPDSFEGIHVRLSAVPVRRPVSVKSQEITEKPIAIVTVHNNVTEGREPSKLQINYRECGTALLEMIRDGSYPDFSNPTGPRRGAPRVNDGLMRLDLEGDVQFASPNALSAFNRLGIPGELVGRSLSEAVTTAVKTKLRVDESLSLVVTGRAPWRSDIESKNLTLSVRAIPLRRNSERYGAIVLCRDVTELRRQERELITKDATIREIHHRVKNNLQTVASLLRIQSRRSQSDEAKDSLEQAMRRVSAIALVHDTLSSGLTQDVNFDEVFDRVMMLASEVASVHGTSVRNLLDGKFGMLKSEVATPLAVALTEIVTNAVEHGLAERSGVVHVNAERKPRRLGITISDNGKGLVDGKVGAGLGTQIIRTLIEGELRGSIRWFSPTEGGTRVVIEIPL